MKPTDEEIRRMAIMRGCIEGTAEYYGFIEGAEYVRNVYERAAIKDRLAEMQEEYCWCSEQEIGNRLCY